MDIIKQLNSVIAYVESNLCYDIDMDKLSSIACVTKDSFMRFFSYMTDMTLNEYIIFCMEKKHLRRINEKYSDIIARKKVVCLYISDEYNFMDRELVELLRSSVEEYI